MSRLPLLVCAVVAVLCIAMPQAASAHDAAPRAATALGLGVCDMSVAVVRDSANRLRRFVPTRYRLGRSLYTLGLPAFGVVVLWTMKCDAVEVGSAPPQQAIVSFAGIQVEAPDRPSSIATIANMFDVYAVATHTDNARVAGRLRAGGMPAMLVSGMRMDRSRSVRIGVPDGIAGHDMRLTPVHADPVGVHRHANAFWHDDEHGRSTRLGLDVPHAEDIACLQLVVICGTVAAGPRSPVAALLGRRRRPVDLVFDHTGLQAGSFTLSRP